MRASFGLDTVRIKVPFRDVRRDVTVLPRHPAGGFALPGRGSVALGGCHAWVEVSLPTRHFGCNVVPFPVTALEYAVADLLAELFEWLVLEVDPRLLEVERLDVDRDFDGVVVVAPLLLGLAHAPRDGRLVAQPYVRRSGSQSLLIKTKQWSITLYDKAAESRGKAPTGRLRCEVRLRRGRLRGPWAAHHGGKVLCIADITEAKLLSLARGTFEHVGFGSTVADTGELARAVGVLPITPARRAQLIGMMVADASGVDLGVNPHTHADYRRLAADNGLAVLPVGDLPPCRLEWTTGKMATV